jgi:serine protease
LIAAIVLPLSATLYAGAPTSEAASKSPALRTHRIVIKTQPAKDGIVTAAAGSALAQSISTATGRSLAYSHQAIDDVAVLTTTPMSTAEAMRLARRVAMQPGVVYAEADTRKFKMLAPNDPRYPIPPGPNPADFGQWHYQTVNTSTSSPNYGINAPAAWDITTGSASLVVAVLDSGIVSHADFAGRTVAGYDFITDTPTANDGNARDNDPSDPGDWVTQAESDAVGGPFEGCLVEDSSWHGSHVAGTIGAATNNNLGVAGVNWNSKVQPVRVLGKCGGFNSDIAAGIVWAAGGTVASVPGNATAAKIINLSLGGGTCPQVFRDAIAQANALGALAVVAAGNSDAGAGGEAPSNCPGVIGVSATDFDGARASYSNFGRPATISGPGGDFRGVLSTINSGTQAPNPGGDDYAQYRGTSMAAPHVAGVASLMLSVRPSLQSNHLAAMMRGTATPYAGGFNSFFDCERNQCGDGIVNAAAAVAAAQACTSPPSGRAATLTDACNGDYDGNGVVETLTDGLIAIRLSMGTTGTGVTNGALGACATRTTFAAIRTWSNRNCGTNN